jgi:tetracycline repressor-like protein
MTKHLSKTNGQPHPRSLGKRNANRPSARKCIFDTASELFYLKGIRAVGVETIAAEADTTKMSLYRNFPSKDELVVVCRERSVSIRIWSAGTGKAQNTASSEPMGARAGTGSSPSKSPGP